MGVGRFHTTGQGLEPPARKMLSFGSGPGMVSPLVAPCLGGSAQEIWARSTWGGLAPECRESEFGLPSPYGGRIQAKLVEGGSSDFPKSSPAHPRPLHGSWNPRGPVSS